MKIGIIMMVVLLIGALVFPVVSRQVEENRRNAQLPAKQLAFFNARFVRVQPRESQAVLLPDRKWGWSDHFHRRFDSKSRLLPVVVSQGSQFKTFGADRTTHYIVQHIDEDGLLISGDGLTPFKLKWK